MATSKEDVSLHKRAAALRVTYNVSMMRLRPPSLGFTQAAEVGSRPAGSGAGNCWKRSRVTASTPMRQTITASVCRRPPRETTIQDFNAKACEGNDLLTPSVEGMQVM